MKFCNAIDWVSRAMRIVAELTPKPKFFKSGCVRLTEELPVYKKLKEFVGLLLKLGSRVVAVDKSYVAPLGNSPLSEPLESTRRSVNEVATWLDNSGSTDR